MVGRRFHCDGRDAWHRRSAPRTGRQDVERPLHPAGAGLAVLGTFLLVWANLAVGIVASALLMGIAGIIGAKGRADGMARAMLTTAGSVVVAFVVAELGARDEPIVRPMVEAVGTSVFVALFLASAWMFRKAATYS